MMKSLFLLFFYLNIFGGTAQTTGSPVQEQPATAEEYAEESKKNFIFAGICFASVIIGGVIRHYGNKPPNE